MPAKISIRLADITKHNIGQLRLLITSLLPVQYSEKFFKDIISNWPRENYLVRLAYHNETLVGAITGRRETFDPAKPREVASVLLPGDAHKDKDKKKDGHYRIYISTIGVLAPYRRRGVAATLLQDILAYAEKDGCFEQIYLHVHVGNIEAIEFYKNFGFEVTDTIEDYYKNDVVTPPHCHILTKTL